MANRQSRCLPAILMPLALLPMICASAAHGAQLPSIHAHLIPTPQSKPYIAIIGPDRQLWFTESGANRIGRMNLSDGSFQEFVVPTPHSEPIGLTADRVGSLWFAETGASKIGRLSPRTGRFTEFDCPTANAAPDGLFTDARGTVWFGERLANRIARISGNKIIEYDGLSAGAHPLSLTSRGNAIWFSEADGNRLGSLENGRVRELPLPAGTEPRAMLRHPDGSLWFVATGAHALERLDRANHVQLFALPDQAASPRSLDVDADGRVWFTEDIVNRIGLMSATGRLLAEYALPKGMSGLRGIAVAPDGRVFFAVSDSGEIGELDPVTADSTSRRRAR